MSDWNDTRGTLNRFKKSSLEQLDDDNAAPGRGGDEDNAKRALKRFAKEVREDPSYTAKEYQALQNKRLDDFVYGSAEIIRKEHEAKRSERPPLQRRLPDGTWEYPPEQKYQPLLMDATVAEYNSVLGPKSRFGDGDGSFWDKWVVASVPNSKGMEHSAGYDKYGMPIPRNVTSQTCGFKRFYKSQGSELPSNFGIQTYEQRRQERLKKEGKIPANATSAPGPDFLLRSTDSEKSINFNAAEGGAGARRNSLADRSVASTLMSGRAGSISSLATSAAPVPKLKKGRARVSSDVSRNSSLSPTKIKLSSYERDNYFGESGRATFYNTLRYLIRQQSLLSGLIPGMNGIDILSRLNTPSNAKLQESMDKTDREILQSILPELQSPTLQRANSNVALSAAVQDDEEVGDAKTSKYGKKKKINKLDRIANPFADRTGADGDDDVHDIPGVLSLHRNDSLLAERRADLDHLSRPADAEEALMRPASPRTRYITGCLQNTLIPRPNLLIRKELTSVLNLENQAIGDTMARILANALDGLPFVTEVNIAENNLTDIGMHAILKALTKCRDVTVLNISGNRVETVTMTALSAFLMAPTCNLEKLTMQRVDMHDNQVERLVKSVKKCITLRYLDLGGNKIGLNQFADIAASGGASMANLLETSSSRIEVLKLSWNTLRLADGVRFVKGVGINASVLHLDISFNGIGDDGGSALGNSLRTNRSLTYLNIANNSITPAACFSIATGIMLCRSLTHVDMSNNPICEDGGRAIMRVVAEIGNETQIDITGCSLQGKSESSWFNILHPRVGKDKLKKAVEDIVCNLSQPYDAVVASELLRLANMSTEYDTPRVAYQRPSAGRSESVELVLYENFAVAANNGGVTLETDLREESKRLLIKLMENDDGQKRIKYWGAVEKDGVLVSLGSRRIDIDDCHSLLVDLGFKHQEDIRLMLQMLFDFYSVSTLPVVSSDARPASRAAGSAQSVTQAEVARFLVELSNYYSRVRTNEGLSRYYCESLDSPGAYLPPSEGTMSIRLNFASKYPSHFYTLSSRNVVNIVDTAMKSSQPSLAIEYGLTHSKLRFAEAQYVFRVLLQDMGSNVRVAATLLPKLATSLDVKLFKSLTKSFSAHEQWLVKAELGGLYRCINGCIGGSYTLLLLNEYDVQCLVQLLRRSILAQADQRNADFLGCAGSGLVGFRNVILDGEVADISTQWLEDMPNIGKLEFDYVDYASGLNNKLPMLSDLRFYSMLESLELINDRMKPEFEKRLLDIRQSIEKEQDAMEGGYDFAPTASGLRSHAVKRDDASETTMQSGVGGTPIWRMDEKSAEKALDYCTWCHEQKGNREKAKNPPAKINNTLVGDYGAKHVKKAKKLDEVEPIELDEPIIFLSAEAYGARKTYATASKESKDTVVARIIDGIVTEVATMSITCDMLATLLLLLPFRSHKKDNFSTFRVELITQLYANIADKRNFDRIVRLLCSAEVGMLMFGLGPLALFDAARPRGYYALNLEHYEDRLIARALLHLSGVCKGAVDGVMAAEAAEAAGVPIEKETKDPKSSIPPTDNGTAGNASEHAYMSQIKYKFKLENGEDKVQEYDNEFVIPADWLVPPLFPTTGTLQFFFRGSPNPDSPAYVYLMSGEFIKEGRVSVLEVLKARHIATEEELES